MSRALVIELHGRFCRGLPQVGQRPETPVFVPSQVESLGHEFHPDLCGPWSGRPEPRRARSQSPAPSASTLNRPALNRGETSAAAPPHHGGSVPQTTAKDSRGARRSRWNSPLRPLVARTGAPSGTQSSSEKSWQGTSNPTGGTSSANEPDGWKRTSRPRAPAPRAHTPVDRETRRRRPGDGPADASAPPSGIAPRARRRRTRCRAEPRPALEIGPDRSLRLSSSPRRRDRAGSGAPTDDRSTPRVRRDRASAGDVYRRPMTSGDQGGPRRSPPATTGCAERGPARRTRLARIPPLDDPGRTDAGRDDGGREQPPRAHLGQRQLLERARSRCRQGARIYSRHPQENRVRGDRNVASWATPRVMAEPPASQNLVTAAALVMARPSRRPHSSSKVAATTRRALGPCGRGQETWRTPSSRNAVAPGTVTAALGAPSAKPGR